MKKIVLAIGGMTCSACSSGLEKFLNKQNGIYSASVNLILSNATISYDDNILNLEKIEQLVKKSGFKSLGIFNNMDLETKNKKEKFHIIVFSILTVIFMYISMGHMFHLPITNALNPDMHPVSYTTTLFSLTILFLIYGYDILKNGFKNLIHRTANMDTLVLLSVITSFSYSLYNMYLVILGNTDRITNLYFESTAIVIYFVKLGRYIGNLNKNKTKDALQKLVIITPSKAIKKIDGKEVEITLDQIYKNDILICKPGNKIAVDGTIISGSGHLDESFITGESKPIIKKIGDEVLAGSLNYDGYIEYKAKKIGKESTVSEIVKLVIDSSNSKTKTEKLADKISGIFVPFIILVAFITLFLYIIITHNLTLSITTFVSVLLVACPCSLGLATPLAIIVSEGLCLKNGILIKKGDILEKICKTNTVVFDKTGTLTYGELKISKIFNYSNLKDEDIFRYVSILESRSTHPISKAFLSYSKKVDSTQLNISNYENLNGLGIKGCINNNNFLIGNSKLLKQYSISNSHLDDENFLSSLGHSIIYVVRNNTIIALIGVSDIIRNNAKETISKLNNLNISTYMVTGDNDKTAKNIANEIGITNIVSSAMPKDKVNIIKKLKDDKNIVIMCGDGINDSPALSCSNIGISIQSGTEIAIDSADVILTNNDLLSIIKLINIGLKTRKIVKQNLFWAFFYNLIMIPIAIGILKPLGITLSPMMASLAMIFSSICVILNTLRLKF